MPPEPDAELLRHQAFLHRLARSLVSDEPTALDLVQDANAAYLAAPPRDGDATRAWLARVMRRLAGKRRRSAVRRGDRERVVARSEIVDDGLARIDVELDAQSTLVRLVQSLPAAQREAVVLRYHHDEAPAEIARRLRVSVHTIHTRLRRALERLRSEMDRSTGGDRGRWAVALLPDLGGNETAALSSAGAAAASLGVFTMATMMKWTAAAAVVGIGATLAWRSGPSGPVVRVVQEEAPAVQPVELAIVDEATDEREAAPVEEDPALPSEAALAAEAAERERSHWIVDVNAVGDGVDVKPTELVITGIHGYHWPEEHALRVTVDAPGRSEFDLRDLLAPWDARFARKNALTGFRVRVEHPDCPSQIVQGTIVSDGSRDAVPDERPTLSIELRRSAVVTGRVTFEESERATSSAVVAFAMGEDGAPAEGGTLGVSAVDSEGRFRLRMTTSGSVAVVAIGRDHRPETRLVSLDLGATHDVGVLEVSTGNALSGRLTWAGEPVDAGSRLILFDESQGFSRFLGFGVVDFMADLRWANDRFEIGRRDLLLEEDGRFRISGLASDPVHLRLNALPDRRVRSWSARWGPFTPPRAVDLELDAARLDVTFDFGESEPADGQVVATFAEDETIHASLPAWSLQKEPWRFAAPPDAPLTIRATFEGYAAAEVTARAPAAVGETLSLTIPVRREQAVGALQVELLVDGEVLADETRLQFELTAGDADPIHRTALVQDGSASIDRLPAGTYSASVYPGTSQSWRSTRRLDAVFEFDLGPNETHVERQELAPGGNVLFEARAPEGHLVEMQWYAEVVDASGETLDLWFQTNTASGSYGGWTDRGPSELMGNLPVGTYTVRLRHPEYEERDVPFEIVEDEVTQRVFELVRR
ncbi:MAG: RNA polymerase sigma factor [Planctomycetota bacterium]